MYDDEDLRVISSSPSWVISLTRRQPLSRPFLARDLRGRGGLHHCIWRLFHQSSGIAAEDFPSTQHRQKRVANHMKACCLMSLPTTISRPKLRNSSKGKYVTNGEDRHVTCSSTERVHSAVNHLYGEAGNFLHIARKILWIFLTRHCNPVEDRVQDLLRSPAFPSIAAH
jgi:hypothetical protein